MQTIVDVCAPICKPERPPCLACRGEGVVFGKSCRYCNSSGQSQPSPTLSPRLVRQQAPFIYRATIGTEAIDQGSEVCSFVAQLIATFPQTEDHIAIWEERPGRTVLRCVIMPNEQGYAKAAWL